MTLRIFDRVRELDPRNPMLVEGNVVDISDDRARVRWDNGLVCRIPVAALRSEADVPRGFLLLPRV